METKKYFCGSTTAFKLNVALAVFFGVVALFCVILLVSPILMYRVYDDILYDFVDDPYLVVAIALVICGVLFFSFFKQWRILSRTPVVEIGADGIIVSNLNNGEQSHIAYQYIERVELSHIKLFGAKIDCINIIPAEGALNKIVYRAKKSDKKRMEMFYKNYGAIAQLHSSNFDIAIEAVCEDIQTALESHKKAQGANKKEEE